MASWGVGHLDVFVLGADSAAYQKRFLANSWTPSWTSLGGTFMHEPVALSTQPGSIDAFAIGVDGNLWWKRYAHDQDAWLPSVEGWFNLNAISCSGSSSAPAEWIDKPAVVSWGPDKINVFVVDRYHKLWRNYYNGWTWSGFVCLGGEHMHVPAVVSTAPKHLDIFSVGSDNVIYHKWFDGLVWGPHGVGGDWESTQQKCVNGEVRAMTRPGDTTGIIDVFCVGWNSELYYKSGKAGRNGWKTWDYPWWRSLGVTSRSSPTVVALDTQRLQVFVTGSKTGLQSLVSNNGGITWKEEATSSMTTPIASAGKRDKDYLSTLITSFNHSTSIYKPPVVPLTRLTSG